MNRLLCRALAMRDQAQAALAEHRVDIARIAEHGPDATDDDWQLIWAVFLAAAGDMEIRAAVAASDGEVGKLEGGARRLEAAEKVVGAAEAWAGASPDYADQMLSLNDLLNALVRYRKKYPRPLPEEVSSGG